MSGSVTREFDSVAAVERAHSRIRDIRSNLEAVGENETERAVEAYRDAHRLLDRYVDDATGTGDFKSYVEFRGEFSSLVDGLPEWLPRREAFEDALEAVDKRRLNASDFERARDALSDVDELVDLVEGREDARKEYRDARLDATERRADVEDRIEELRRLQTLGEADLDAPVEELRAPVQRYNEGVREAFRTYRKEAPASEFLSFVERTEYFPLVEFPAPPDDLLEYVRTSPDGDEPVPTLLEYADYSQSKLQHYADDADSLKRNVATQQTYLERLDAEPLTVDWPPRETETLRWRVEERMSVAGRFAPDSVLADLRTVRERTFDRERFEYLQNAATAIHHLDAEDRERLKSGAVSADLERLQAEREAIDETLDELPDP